MGNNYSEEVICSHILNMNYAHQLMTKDGCNNLSDKLGIKNVSLKRKRQTANVSDFYVLFAHIYSTMFIVFSSFEVYHSKLSMKQYYSEDETEQFWQDLALFKQIASDKDAVDFNQVVPRHPTCLERSQSSKEHVYCQYFQSILQMGEYHSEAQCEIESFLSVLFVNDFETGQWRIHPDLTLKRLKEYSLIIKRFLMQYLVKLDEYKHSIDAAYNQIVLLKLAHVQK